MPEAAYKYRLSSNLHNEAAAVYLFPITHYHKLGTLKQNYILSQSGSQKSKIHSTGLNQGVGSVTLPLEALEENHSLPFLASGGSRCSLACGHIDPISASMNTSPRLLGVSNLPCDYISGPAG